MTPNILFDASRLLTRTMRDAPTGIDRVCLAYAEWLIDHPAYRMVPVKGRAGQLAMVDNQWFRQQITALRARWDGCAHKPLRAEDQALLSALSQESRPRLSLQSPVPVEAPKPKLRKRAFQQFIRARRVEKIPSALAYINVGHTGLNEPEPLSTLKASGIATILMVHDLIPVTHPEYCRPGDDQKHHQRMVHALTMGSHIIANSQYTADELKAFAIANTLPEVPTQVAHLGIEKHLLDTTPSRSARPYFVHIGTIEARKNLAFLLTLWRRLEERMGDKSPSLVLVGQYGWENESVLDHLERSPNLQGLVHQISGISDDGLSTLLSGARALVAPSSVEGFDLPAVEASAMGLPIIASDIPAHRELTPHARLVDPIDGLGWVEALQDWTLNAPTAPSYKAPTWEAHFQLIEQQILTPLAARCLEM